MLRFFRFGGAGSGIPVLGEVARAVPAQCKATQHLPFLADGAHSPSRFGGLRQGIRKGTRVGPLLAGRQVRVGQL